MALEPAAGFTAPANVLKAIAFVAIFLTAAATLLAIGNGDLSRPDWDLEWLATLPMPLSTVLGARILTRAVLLPMGLAALWPFLTVIAWKAGHGFAAPLAGMAATIPLMLIAATAQTLCDTGLRLTLGPSQLRNLQAVIAVAALVALYIAIAPGVGKGNRLVMDWSLALPSWTFWLPPGLAIQTLTSTSAVGAVQALGLLAAEALLIMLLGVLVLKRQLRFGIVAAGARESGRAKPKAVRAAARARPSDRSLLTPVQRRELLLLGRDRTFLVQTLVMPVMLIGGQLLLNGGAAASIASVNQHPEWVASIAFGMAAYALMFSAFQTLNAEGHALWILYTVPQSLESVLRQKAILWGTACLFYPVAIFGFLVILQGAPSPQFIQLAVVVLIGIPIFATIATALGVFACDPLAQTVQRRVRISYSYLYMGLSSIYLYALFASTIWQRVGLFVLTASLALALWQKARDQLPYLLDPAVSPPARVSISDGLIAALLFFVLQGAVISIQAFESEGKALTGYNVLVAFVIAGAVTFLIMRTAFWRLKSQGVPRTFGPGALRAVMLGTVAGLFAACGAFVYLQVASHLPLFEQARQTVLLGRSDIWMISILAICAAPVFEEFIFRGLIFGGLRRSIGPAGSMLASAAIFAIVHPPFSVIPVFGLGLVAALVYGRTRLLIGAMAAHATYNALIVAFQFWF
jgi:membrane protease YdiL (CAAX protease family)